jgi:hypothetical protein
MSAEHEPILERAYRYHAGWLTMGCLSLFFGAIGAAGLTFLPVGCEKMRNGEMVSGVFIAAACLIATSALLLAVIALGLGVFHIIRPPLLRVTPTALILPQSLRGSATLDSSGKEVKPPPQPEEVPFSAIRWVRRETGSTPDTAKLMIVHDLSPATLVIDRSMMSREDFEELETVLRSAVPDVFGPAPLPPPSPPTEP